MAGTVPKQETQSRATVGSRVALSIPKILSGANAFEISDIQEERTREPVITKRPDCTMLHFAENRCTEFLRTTAQKPNGTSEIPRPWKMVPAVIPLQMFLL